MMHSSNGLNPDQERARDAVRRLPTPEAPAGFRLQLKRDFTEGTIRLPRRQTEEIGRFPRPILISVAMTVAAVIALLFVSIGNRGPSWEVRNPEPGGRLVVNGESIVMDETDTIRSLLRPGARLAVEDPIDVTIACDRHLLLQLTPGTEIVLPANPRRWFGRDLRTEIVHGMLFITTGERFRGATLTVATPEATVEVLGTTLAVILESYGTCVCVAQGSVRVGTDEDSIETVPEGKRKVFYKDGSPPSLEEISPSERAMFERLQAL
jgi:hypothetical protein